MADSFPVIGILGEEFHSLLADNLSPDTFGLSKAAAEQTQEYHAVEKQHEDPKYVTQPKCQIHIHSPLPSVFPVQDHQALQKQLRIHDHLVPAMGGDDGG